MKLSQFDYILPKQLIAQKPCRPRDHSRLLILGRRHKITKQHKDVVDNKISHHKFYEIEKFLKKGDVLVLNNSKVIPARLFGRREATGGKVEVFLLRQQGANAWECLVGGHNIRPGLKLIFSQTLKGKLIAKIEDGQWSIEFNKRGQSLKKEIYKIGNVPIPPYIKHPTSDIKHLTSDYQTIYAKHEGSVAAPTAGFHFTKQLLNRLKKKGVQIEFVALHVGLGTFVPVKTENIKDHKMHPEFATIDKLTCARLNKAKREGRRIIAVGTTSVRVLESAAKQINIKQFKHLSAEALAKEDQASSNSSRQTPVRRSFSEGGSHILHPTSNNINTFIYPGYKFKFIDAMITNFHLPKSTLLMLVSAFAGREKILSAYREAIKKKYRFYSFGDAMFIC